MSQFRMIGGKFGAVMMRGVVVAIVASLLAGGFCSGCAEPPEGEPGPEGEGGPGAEGPGPSGDHGGGGAAAGEGGGLGELASISGTDSRLAGVCFPKGSMERQAPNRIAILERSDGATPCTGFLVGTWPQPPNQPDAYLMTWGRCRPRPGVAVVAWFGAQQVECGTKAVSSGEAFFVTGTQGDMGSDDLPALVRVQPGAWVFSGLDVSPPLPGPMPSATPFILPQYAAGGVDRSALVTSHTQGPECASGVALGSTFVHGCDTSNATSGPEVAQGAPLLAPMPGGGYWVAGMHAGPQGGGNTGLTVNALAGLLALAP